MFEKTVSARKTITFVLYLVLLALSALTLVFGSGEDRLKSVAITYLTAVIIYFFIRFTLYVVGKRAPAGYMRFAFWFFFMMGCFSVLASCVTVISHFSKELDISLGASVSLVSAVLADGEKRV